MQNDGEKTSAAHADRKPGWLLSRTLVWPQSGVCVKGRGHRSVLFGLSWLWRAFVGPEK